MILIDSKQRIFNLWNHNNDDDIIWQLMIKWLTYNSDKNGYNDVDKLVFYIYV